MPPYHFELRQHELNRERRLSFPSLVALLQESAGRHAAELGVGSENLQREGLGWVLYRLHVELSPEQPGYPATVGVDTWPTGNERFFMFRSFLVRDAQNRTLAKATTTWLVFDLERRRMVNPPDWVRAAGSNDRSDALPRATSRLRLPDDSLYQQTRRVRWYDLDQNQHTNHITYLRSCIETFPLSWLSIRDLIGFDIQFKTESGLNDVLVAKATPLDDCNATHQIEQLDGRVVAVARSRWKLG